MESSKAYRAKNVQLVDVSKLLAGHEGQAAVVGVDVGKSSLYLVVRWADGVIERPIQVEQPAQLGLAVTFLQGLHADRSLKVALEPTGTYGDPFRYACHQAGLTVERVSPVASQRHAEVYDGVPSQHDGKDAAVVAELCWLGKSKPWPWDIGTSEEQALAMHADLMDCYQEEHNAWRGRLEGKLARHWPEVLELLALDSATLLALLGHYGTPAALAADRQAQVRLAGWGRHYLTPEKITAILNSAQQTRGAPMTPADRAALVEIAQRALESKQRLTTHQQAVEGLSVQLPETALLGSALGQATTAILRVETGDPAAYGSARAYQRALGLNLAERSSGKYVGRLHISKRGSARGRRWLYLAALRLLSKPGVSQWYQAKVARDGGRKGKAIVAIMRKMAAGIHHCARTGEAFNPQRLFQNRWAARRQEKRAAAPAPAPVDLSSS